MKYPLYTLTLFIACLFASPSGAKENLSSADSSVVLSPQQPDSIRKVKGIKKPFYWLGQYLKNTNKQSYKPFDWTILGGPFFNSTSGLGIAGGLTGLYSYDRKDSTLQRSDATAVFAIGVTGQMQVGFRGHNYMKHDKYRWDYQLFFYYLPSKFWGLGYHRALHDYNESLYRQIKLEFKPNFLFRVAKNFYVGPQLYMQLCRTYEFDDHSDTLLIGKHGLQNHNIQTYGGGVIIQYDSRDFAQNAYRGHFLKIEQMFYPKLLNKYYFNSTDITYTTYVRPYKSAILAFELHGLYNYASTRGEVPWTMLAKSGAGNRLRGYYEGRYMDNGIVEAQIELRQHIRKRWGACVWIGGGNVFNSFKTFDANHFLPSYGVGARWEMKHRVNIRFDMGFTRNSPGFCFNIGEAF